MRSSNLVDHRQCKHVVHPQEGKLASAACGFCFGSSAILYKSPPPFQQSGRGGTAVLPFLLSSRTAPNDGAQIISPQSLVFTSYQKELRERGGGFCFVCCVGALAEPTPGEGSTSHLLSRRPRPLEPPHSPLPAGEGAAGSLAPLTCPRIPAGP